MIAYDRRGRGDSGDTLPYARERENEDLAEVLDAAGGRAAVFGHSSGAVLALDAAAAGLPITRLAVYQPPFITDASRPPVPRDHLARLEASDSPRERLGILMVEAVGMPPAAIEGIEDWPVWPQLASVAHHRRLRRAVHGGADVRGAAAARPVGRVTLPTLVMAGGASATLRVLEGQDHGPADDVLGGALRELLAGRGPIPVGVAVGDGDGDGDGTAELLHAARVERTDPADEVRSQDEAEVVEHGDAVAVDPVGTLRVCAVAGFELSGYACASATSDGEPGAGAMVAAACSRSR